MKGRKIICYVLIIAVIFSISLVPRRTEAVFPLVPAVATIAWKGGLSQVILGSALVGVAGYFGHRFVEGVMNLRMQAAYNAMTDAERASVNTLAATNVTTVTHDTIVNAGARTILNSLTGEFIRDLADGVHGSITVSKPQKDVPGATLPVSMINIPAANPTMHNRMIENIKAFNLPDLTWQMAITTAGGAFVWANGSMNLYMNNRAWVVPAAPHVLTQVFYRVTNTVTGQVAVIRLFVMQGQAIYTNTAQTGITVGADTPNTAFKVRFGESTHDHIEIGRGGNIPTTSNTTLSHVASSIASELNRVFGITTFTTSAIMGIIAGYIPGVNLEMVYSPPLLDQARLTTVPMPQQVVVTPTTLNPKSAVARQTTTTGVLTNNPALNTSLQTGVHTADFVNSLTAAVTVPVVSELQGIVGAINRFFDFTIPINFKPLLGLGDLLSTRFPFSLPFDLLSAFQEMARQPSNVLIFPIAFNDGLLGNVNFDVDLRKFEAVILFTRSMMLFLFVAGLALITPKIIKI